MGFNTAELRGQFLFHRGGPEKARPLLIIGDVAWLPQAGRLLGGRLRWGWRWVRDTGGYVRERNYSGRGAIPTVQVVTRRYRAAFARRTDSEHPAVARLYKSPRLAGP